MAVAVKPIMTAEGERTKQEWNGFRNMLKDVGDFPMREVGSIALWDHFLVYAVSLERGRQSHETDAGRIPGE